jgi:hypothetical protein
LHRPALIRSMQGRQQHSKRYTAHGMRAGTTKSSASWHLDLVDRTHLQYATAPSNNFVLNYNFCVSLQPVCSVAMTCLLLPWLRAALFVVVQLSQCCFAFILFIKVHPSGGGDDYS